MASYYGKHNFPTICFPSGRKAIKRHLNASLSILSRQTPAPWRDWTTCGTVCKFTISLFFSVKSYWNTIATPLHVHSWRALRTSQLVNSAFSIRILYNIMHISNANENICGVIWRIYIYNYWLNRRCKWIFAYPDDMCPRVHSRSNSTFTHRIILWYV